MTILSVVPAPAATFVAAMAVGMLMFRLVPSSTSNPKAVRGADA